MFSMISRCLMLFCLWPFAVSAEVTSNNGLYIDGEPFFPLFAWAVPRKRLDFNQQMGLNAIVPGEKPEKEGGRKALLDDLAQREMYGMLDAGNYSDELAAHDALLLWKFGDEPDMKNIMPEALIKEYKELNEKDPKHPVWINLTPRFFDHYYKSYHAKGKCPDRETYKDYAKACDAISFDHYPVTGWNQPQRVHELYHATKDFCTLYPDRTVFVIVESADQDLKWTPKETRGPTPQETKAMVWMSIIGGAKGIGYFHVAFEPFRWDNLSAEMKKELPAVNKQITALAPAIVAGKNLEISSDNDQVPARAVTYQGKAYLFAVNLTRKKETATFTVTGNYQTATVIDEDRERTVNKHTFSDDFDALGVHLYALE